MTASFAQAGDLTIGKDPDGDKNGLLAGTTLGHVTDSYSYNDFGELEYYQALHDGTDNLYEVFYKVSDQPRRDDAQAAPCGPV